MTDKAITQATERVRELHDRELTLSHKLIELQANTTNEGVIRQARAKSFNLDGILNTVASTATAHGQLAALSQAVDAVRGERRAAILEVLRLEAGQKRADADKLAAEIEQRKERVAVLRAELLELDECQYVPVNARSMYKVGGTATVVRTKTQAMERELRGRRQEAELHEKQRARDSGGITVRGRNSIIEAIEQGDPFTIMPRLDSVLNWYDEQHAHLCRQAGIPTDTDMPLTGTIGFSNGRITAGRLALPGRDNAMSTASERGLVRA